MSSPCAWRCFSANRSCNVGSFVVPICVRVFQCIWKRCFYMYQFLHKYGGVSLASSFVLASSWSSPRLWRCFQRNGKLNDNPCVGFILVEVFLLSTSRCWLSNRILHLSSGGVSHKDVAIARIVSLSSRLWRCFSSTRTVASYPYVSLHKCGGVSNCQMNQVSALQSSPRVWRCFCRIVHDALKPTVVSTCVEVFPRRTKF